MKKLILLSAVLVGMAMQATAQNVNRESLLARIQKMETATKDPKKEGKAVTWINVAKSYVDAAVEPTKDLYVGMVPMMIPAQLEDGYGVGIPLLHGTFGERSGGRVVSDATGARGCYRGGVEGTDACV